jgi:hypothetical protein
MMTRETRIEVSPSVYARAFGDEIVLLDFGRGEYFGLDAVAADVWRGIEAGESLGAITDAIVGRYQVEPDEAYRDIVELVRHLQDELLVRVAC